MGFNRNMFIINVGLVLMFVMANCYEVSSYGENVLTTKLTNGDIFVLMLDKKESENENERSSKYVIISFDGETIGKEHVLHNCGYTDKANLQTLSDQMVVLADNTKFYLINYNDNTCKSIDSYHYTKSNSGTVTQEESKLGRIALAVNIKENEFIIADVRENSKQIVLYNVQGEKQTFTEITSKDITNLECGVIGTEQIKYICFYPDTNNKGCDIYYKIFDKRLLSGSSELKGNGNGDIYFQGSKNKGIQMIPMDTNVYLLCGLFEEDSSFHVICLTFKEKENENDSSPIIKIAHYNNGNDHYSAVTECKDNIPFSIAKVSSTNYIATCQKGDNNISFSSITTENNKMHFSIEFQTILHLSEPTYLTSFTTNDSDKPNIGIIYIKNNKVILKYYFLNHCNDFNVGSFWCGEKGSLDFAKYIDLPISYYVEKIVPSKIKITDYNNNNIIIYHENKEINPVNIDEYSFEDFFTFEIKTRTQTETFPDKIEFTYNVKFTSDTTTNWEGKLIFNIKSCYKTCATCKNVGDASNMKCTSCSEDCYPKEEERNNIEFNCYSNVPDGYCDSEEQKSTLGWKKCNKACETCSKCSDDEDETLCKSCNKIEYYYPLSDNKTKCYSKDRNDLGRFLKNNEWEQCNTGCKTCVEKNNCTSCNTDYYLLIEKEKDGGSSMCYKEEDTKPTNTFLDKTLKPPMYQYCNEACATCKSKGYFSFDTKCETCAKDYCEFPKENNNDIFGEDVTDDKQCYHKDTKINNYYVVNNNDETCEFKSCPTNCTQCSKDSISENKCISCNKAKDYYPIQQESTNNNHIECYKKGDEIEGLFFDEKKNFFKRCDKACKFCSKQSTSISTNCDECAENYFPLEESKLKCYHKEENLKGYYLESNVFKKCSEACVDCSIAPADGKTNCDKQSEGSSCSKNYAPIEEEDNTNNESTQTELPSYVQCYDISQKSIDNYYYNKDKNVFSRCHEACASCTELGDNTNTKCTQCDSSRDPPYYQVENTNNNNVFHCCTEGKNPKNTFFDNGIFKLCHKSCLTCSSKGVDNKSLCDECDTENGYYKMNLIENKLNCINEELKDKYYSNMYLDENYKYKECGKECAKCSQGEHMCTKCAEGFNFRYDHIQKKQSTDCINEDTKHPHYSNYYLSTDGMYKICHSNCETCSKGGNDSNNGCDTCISTLVLHPNKDKHCVCKFYYYITSNNVYSCTPSNECPDEYHFVYEHERKCSNKCTEPYVFHENECLIDCPEETEKDINSNECLPKDRCRIKQYKETIPLNEVSDNIDTIAKNYANEYLSTEKVVALHTHISNKYTISLFKNSDCFSSLIHDLLMLDLASCIDILKQHYNIDTSLYLIILKLDIPRKGQSNQVAYSIYHPITGERLELELCSEEKVTVKVPLTETPGVNVTEAMTFKDLGVDVYNLSDPFFTDICVNYAVDGKDTTLKDRREHFYQNVSFCESGCEFKGVNLTTLEADCVCEIKTDFITDVLDNPITGDVLEMLSSLNFDLMKCYQGVFDIGNAKVNVGGFIMLGFIVAQIAFMIVYIVKGLDNVRKFVDSYVTKGNPPHKGQPNELIITKNDNDNNNSQVTVADEISQTNTNTNRKRLITTQTGENLILKDVNNSASIDFGEQFQPALKPSKLMIMVVNHQNGLFLDDNITKKRMAQKLRLPTNRKRNVPIKHINKNIRRVNLKRKSTSTNSKENTSVNEDNNNQSFEEEDLNEMEHYDAIIYDKRSFCAFYWNQLKIKHPFINTFIDIDVLEVFPIKAICFILNVALLFTLNALLYSEEHISETFNNKAAESNLVALFTDEITRIVYVSMISIVIDYMIDCLFSGKKRILTVIKREEDEEKMKKECMDTIKCMKVKNIIFLIVNFVIMGFFWYYVNAFCNCYKNTVTSWIVSCFVTWGVLLVFPFVVCLLVTVLRFVGLKCKIEILYKLSLCLTD